jgi:hypothetical protein
VDFAFLQEVTEENLPVFKNALDAKYIVQRGRPWESRVQGIDYFTAVCVLKGSKVQFISNNYRPFPGSVMSRGLQIVKVRLSR